MNPSSTDSSHNSRKFLSRGMTDSKSSFAISTSSLSEAGGIRWTALAKRLLIAIKILISNIFILTGFAFLALRARQSSGKSRQPICWLCALPPAAHKAIAPEQRGLLILPKWSLPVDLGQTRSPARKKCSWYPSSQKCTFLWFRQLDPKLALNFKIKVDKFSHFQLTDRFFDDKGLSRTRSANQQDISAFFSFYSWANYGAKLIAGFFYRRPDCRKMIDIYQSL